MSDREMRAMAYSAKCARRERRKNERRDARISGFVKFSFPFSVGLLVMACLIASFV